MTEQTRVRLKVPDSNRKVLAKVRYQNNGYTETLIVSYARQYEMSSMDHHEGWSEYSEEHDEYFCPEGWYARVSCPCDCDWMSLDDAEIVSWIELPEMRCE